MRKDVLQFVKAAIKNPLEVSTVFPTSKALAHLLMEKLVVDEGPVLELGAGTGAITRFLEQRLIDPAQYLGIEINGDMVQFLRKAYPQLRFEQAAADQIERFLPKNSVVSVVSSLPWTMFLGKTQESTLRSIHRALKPQGFFFTYMCINVAWSPAARNFARLLNQTFTHVEKTPVEWRNIPPAFVYRCQKTAP